MKAQLALQDRQYLDRMEQTTELETQLTELKAQVDAKVDLPSLHSGRLTKMVFLKDFRLRLKAIAKARGTKEHGLRTIRKITGYGQTTIINACKMWLSMKEKGLHFTKKSEGESLDLFISLHFSAKKQCDMHERKDYEFPTVDELKRQ